MKKLFLPLILLLFLASCDKEESGNTPKPVTKDNIQGRIEKGPFLTGSKVTLYELDAQLKQTGRNIFATETIDDLGSFSFDSKMELSSQFVEIEINGYFFNEYRNSLSDSQIKLNAIADVSEKNKINVNILTHLEYKRIKKLVGEGARFSDAKKQAKSELLKCFYINEDFKNPEDISFFDGTDASTALLAISAILLEGKKESEFSEYIAMLSNDFGEKGKISNQDLISKIKYSSNNLNSIDIKSNLVNYYKDKGYTINIGDVWKYVDHNGDEVLNDDDYYIVPEDQITGGSIFLSEEDVRASLISCYTSIFSYFQSIIYLDAIRSENKSETNIYLHISPTSSFVSDAYKNAYRTIARNNHMIDALEKLESASFSFDIKPYIATNKILRALVYMDMVQHWGDMPFITQPPSIDNMYISRTEKEKIYAFLEKDLESVKNSLPNEVYTYNNPIAPASLVDAILATIALERKKDASIYLENIINGGIYNLENQSVDIYNLLNSEVIFGLNTKESMPPFSTELRKGKYHPIFRYSGVLLNYAEAIFLKGNTSKAIETVNTVRTAKGLALLSSGSDIKEGIASTWKEVYGMDYGYFILLKRLGLATSELKIPSYMQLLPLPQSELDINPKIMQNPDY